MAIVEARVGAGRGFDGKGRKWSAGLYELLGYHPYPGTLNLSIRPALHYNQMRNTCCPFPDFHCAPCQIKSHSCHCCYSVYRKQVPYISTLYVLSATSLRDAMGLRDRDRLQVHLVDS